MKSNERLAEHLAKFIKKKRQKTQINRIGNEKDVIINTREIQKLWSDYYQQLYTNKMDNIEEVHKFLESQSPKTEP